MNWNPPTHWTQITTIEAHTAGEPLRIITSGLPPIPGDTILAKRRYAQTHLDHLRRALMWEPRGHADMYGCILTDPVTPDGDCGVLFLHNEGFSTMCGHGIIGLTKVALDTGMIIREGDSPLLKIDTPAGRVTAYAQRQAGQVATVSFHNVPSFVYAQDQTVILPDLGPIPYDVAFGGAFYAICQAQHLNIDLTPMHYRSLIDLGQRLKQAIINTLPIQHPTDADLSFLYGTILVGPPSQPHHHSRNVCIFADGEIDRCPTGTGVSARAALHHARGEIGLKQPFTVESILGTTFTSQVITTTTFGPYQAIIPQVTGTAHITGRHQFWLDPNDPLKYGFLLH